MAHDIEKTVAALGDDGYYRPSGIGDDAWDTLMGADATSALHSWYRFNAITIPSGATIDAAHIELWTRQLVGTAPLLKLRADLSADSAAYTTYAQMHARTKTTAGVDWDNITDADAYLASPDFSAVIQELVDTYGGLTNADITIFVLDDGTTATKVIYCNSYDVETHPANLHIDYTASGKQSGGSSTRVARMIAMGMITAPLAACGLYLPKRYYNGFKKAKNHG
jgi:hypothetical protein